MNELFDKGVIFVLCLLMLWLTPVNIVTVMAVLLAIMLTSVNSYLVYRSNVLACLIFYGLAMWRVEFLIFVPLLAIDGMLNEQHWLRLAWLVPVLAWLTRGEPAVLAVVVIFSGIAMLLTHRSQSLLALQEQLRQIRDLSTETTMALTQENKAILNRQDYEVRIATLKERNRIAREIHDNVGHLLTRSLLQIGAMHVVHKEDVALTEQLVQVKSTLTDAMNSVRSSVHDLHEESVDLKTEIQRIIEEFTFCSVRLTYDMKNVPRDLKYSLIAIVREALSNIARHSNATRAQISLLEHPAFYQMIIEDDGAIYKRKNTGLGLQSMKERVESFGGIFENGYQRGFKIFISIPKGRFDE